MPFQLEKKGSKILEKRSPVRRGKKLIYNPNLDLARHSKTLDSRHSKSQYLHSGDLARGKKIPNTQYLSFYCDGGGGHKFSPKQLSNPVKCGKHNKTIGWI